MPMKIRSALGKLCGVVLIWSILDCGCCGLMEQFTETAHWKIHLAIAVPFVFFILWQLWAMYCGMVRDGDWWMDEEHPRRRRW
jgi:hypothetical protein